MGTALHQAIRTDPRSVIDQRSRIGYGQDGRHKNGLKFGTMLLTSFGVIDRSSQKLEEALRRGDWSFPA